MKKGGRRRGKRKRLNIKRAGKGDCREKKIPALVYFSSPKIYLTKIW